MARKEGFSIDCRCVSPQNNVLTLLQGQLRGPTQQRRNQFPRFYRAIQWMSSPRNCLTLSGFPSSLEVNSTPTLHHVLSLIFPLVAALPLPLSALNGTSFCPEPRDEDLHSGCSFLTVQRDLNISLKLKALNSHVFTDR